MISEKIQTNDKHLAHASGKVRVVYYCFIAVLGINSLVWAGLLVASLFSMFSSLDSAALLGQNVYNLVTIALVGAVITLIVYTVTMMLKDVVHEVSPFNSIQIKRIRFIALLVLIYGVLDTFLISNFSTWSGIEGVSFGKTIVSEGNESSISINIGVFATALIVYAFSVIFEYGVKLQQQSDSIL